MGLTDRSVANLLRRAAISYDDFLQLIEARIRQSRSTLLGSGSITDEAGKVRSVRP